MIMLTNHVSKENYYDNEHAGDGAAVVTANSTNSRRNCQTIGKRKLKLKS